MSNCKTKYLYYFYYFNDNRNIFWGISKFIIFKSYVLVWLFEKRLFLRVSSHHWHISSISSRIIQSKLGIPICIWFPFSFFSEFHFPFIYN